jgi:hypothetical protein
MPVSSAEDASMCRNARAILFSPKSASVRSHDLGKRLPDYIASAWRDYQGLAARGNGSTISS